MAGQGLTRQLVLLSATLFVVVLMSIQTAEAIGWPLPLWHKAAMTPFVVIASVIALTPGGLGLNESIAAVTLSFFGTPLAIGVRWILANRGLVAISYLVVAVCAATILLVGKITVARHPTIVEDHECPSAL